MKTSILKAAFMALGLTLCTGTAMAQTEDATTRLKLLQSKANDVNNQLKAQSAKLNKKYNEVDPYIEEQMNDREDSIYLGLLSQKRVYELQMSEIKKAERIKKAKAEAAAATETTTKVVVAKKGATPRKLKVTNVSKKKK